MDVNLTSQKYRVLIISKKKCELMRSHRYESNVFCIGTDQLWFSIQDQSSLKITDFSPHQMQSLNLQFSSVQSLSRVWLFAIPWIAAHQASLFITNSQSSLRLTSIEPVMPISHLILCRPLFLLPPIPPSISLFQWVNSSHEVAKVLEFQL